MLNSAHNRERGSIDPNRAPGSIDPNRAPGSIDPNQDRGSIDPNRARGSIDPNRARGSIDPNQARGSIDPNRARGSIDPNQARGSIDRDQARGSIDRELGPFIDLNCDMGEGMDSDEAIFPLISSANIACGGHTGDTGSMRRTVELAMRHGVAIGAHPSYPDREGFGRRDMLETAPGNPSSGGPGGAVPPRERGPDREISMQELEDSLRRQLAGLQSVCRELGVRLRHVKPHGALYNFAAKNAAVSALVCRVMTDTDHSLLLYGLSGSIMREQAAASGIRFVSEVFADRTYQADGSLTPRSQPHALIHDPVAMMSQVFRMVRDGRVRAFNGSTVAIAADTICLHGDGDHAVEFARIIRGGLDRNGIGVRAPKG